jgi:hypothetical protein
VNVPLATTTPPLAIVQPVGAELPQGAESVTGAPNPFGTVTTPFAAGGSGVLTTTFGGGGPTGVSPTSCVATAGAAIETGPTVVAVAVAGLLAVGYALIV